MRHNKNVLHMLTARSETAKYNKNIAKRHKDIKDKYRNIKYKRSRLFVKIIMAVKQLIFLIALMVQLLF